MPEKKIIIPLDPKLEGVAPPIPNENYKKQMVDPIDNLTEDEDRECAIRAIEKVKKEHDKDLTLLKSSIQIPKQNYALVTFVGPTLNQKTHDRTNGMKIWGAFNTLEQAQNHAQYINSTVENKEFDIYVVEMYEFLLVPPDPSKIDDTEYSDKKLNEIIKKYKAQQYKQKEVFDLRKHKLMNNPDINKLIKEDKVRVNHPVGNPAIQAQLESFENIEETNDEFRKKVIHQEKMPEFEVELINDDKKEEFEKIDKVEVSQDDIDDYFKS